jgi:hypothetical protein
VPESQTACRHISVRGAPATRIMSAACGLMVSGDLQVSQQLVRAQPDKSVAAVAIVGLHVEPAPAVFQQETHIGIVTSRWGNCTRGILSQQLRQLPP